MATIRKIVLAIKDAMRKVVKDPNRIYVVANRPAQAMPHLVGDRDLIIRVRGFSVGDGNILGAGRSNTTIKRLIDIVLRDRMAVDQSSADLQWLTKEGLGHLDGEDQIIDAMQMWLGNDAENELLLVGEGEPVRIVGGADAAREFGSGDGKWGSSAITLEVVYRQEMDQEVQ